jgi:hypothetical protein
MFLKYNPEHYFPGRTEKNRDPSYADVDNEFDSRFVLYLIREHFCFWCNE